MTSDKVVTTNVAT